MWTARARVLRRRRWPPRRRQDDDRYSACELPLHSPFPHTIGRSSALRDVQQRLPVRQFHARPSLGDAGGAFMLVDAMPARGVDGDRQDVGPALGIAVGQPIEHLLGHGMGLAAVGRYGARRPTLGPADGKELLAPRKILARVADAG